jgi:hypothetical protein
MPQPRSMQSIIVACAISLTSGRGVRASFESLNHLTLYLHLPGMVLAPDIVDTRVRAHARHRRGQYSTVSHAAASWMQLRIPSQLATCIGRISRGSQTLLKGSPPRPPRTHCDGNGLPRDHLQHGGRHGACKGTWLPEVR